MGRVISATEARIRFGELIRKVVEDQEPVIVERGGKPYVVVISFEEYNKLRAGKLQPAWRDTLEEMVHLGAEIKARRGEQPLIPPPEEIIHELREERDAGLTGLYGCQLSHPPSGKL